MGTNITAGRDVKGVITESDNSTLNYSNKITIQYLKNEKKKSLLIGLFLGLLGGLTVNLIYDLLKTYILEMI